MVQTESETGMLPKPPSHAPPDRRYEPTRGTARALGWFSVALGSVELLAPTSFGRMIGVGRPGLLQLFGAREIAAGVGLLTQPTRPQWMWARVFGDLLDIAVLLEAAAPGLSSSPRHARSRALGALTAVAGVTLLDVAVAVEESALRAIDR